MSKSVLTPIEEKKKNINDTNESARQNKWLLFGISIITNILIVFFVGIIGANFIYMTTAINKVHDTGVNLLEHLLPTDESTYFPQNESFKGGKKATWPYSMYNRDSGYGFTKNFQNWFAKSIADSYITNRSLLKKWLVLFSPDKENKNIFSNETFQMIVIAPLMILLIPLIAIFMYFSIWFSEFKSGWGFTLIGMLLIYSWVITSSVSFIQSMQYLFTFTILPLIVDYKQIKKIIGNNVNTLSLLFGLLACSSAFSYLDNTISITMFIVYVFLIIKKYW
jgi:hypothetical protein